MDPYTYEEYVEMFRYCWKRRELYKARLRHIINTLQGHKIRNSIDFANRIQKEIGILGRSMRRALAR